ncbi:MAG: hypothetical protein GEV09_03400 [Pseudonocardiaceae bacterium]|nr:hypothetical protein [Pseudonocardiaceae bacterium]
MTSARALAGGGGRRAHTRAGGRWLLAVLAVLAMAASACSSGAQGGAASGTGEPDPNATFRYVFVQDPSSFDPHTSANPWDMVFLRLVYDQLIQQGPNGELRPMLATSWEFSPDGSAVTMSLRDDVTFQDGTPFNAAAVKANLVRARDMAESTLSGSLQVIESIEVVDEYKARINLNGPGGNLPALFTGRYGTMISPAAMDNPDLDQQPVGSGMFGLVEFVPGQVTRYVANENYWDPSAVKVDKFEIYVQKSSPTRLNMLRTGQADMTYLLPADTQQAKASGLHVAPSKSLSIMSFYMNTGRPPFDDYRVRQAVEHAIDKKALVQGIFFGAGKAVAQFLPPSHWAYHPGITPQNPKYAYNPQRARQLLAEVGYPNGFEFEFLVPALDDHRAVAQAIVPMLAEVGITAHTRVIESASTAVTFYGREEGDAFPGMGAPFADPTIQYEDNLPGQYGNPWNTTSPEFIAAYQSALEGATRQQRLPALHTMIAEEKELRRVIPMFAATPPSAWTDEVIFPEGYEPAYAPTFRGVGKTK